MVRLGKRLLVCCDGTWKSADSGTTQPNFFNSNRVVEIPSNVTRIARAFRREGRDGKPQIIYYQSGVGTGTSFIDTLTGGLFGLGIAENVREAYAFITANYMAGDEIILVGFSRGSFTARSIAGMISEIGLLTRKGMRYFYAIFKDMENFNTHNYHDVFPNEPFGNKPSGPNKAAEYKQMLIDQNLTRVVNRDGTPIEIKAVGVFDTVGSLGIPNIGYLAKLGLEHPIKEYKFYNTALSNIVKHAFHALALDEKRGSFSPAIWEKPADNTTDLRQVWFPGVHTNIGGGYADQELANITLAWMMDQLSSIGVTFNEDVVDQIFTETKCYYESQPTKTFASKDITSTYSPVRPYGLGKITESQSIWWKIAGTSIRAPGFNMRADPDTGEPQKPPIPLQGTNERIHPSVRVRLQGEGLGPDDKGKYKCPALAPGDLWRYVRTKSDLYDPVAYASSWDDANGGTQKGAERWVWEYCGPEDKAPVQRILVEENIGSIERRLLELDKGIWGKVVAE